MNILRKGQWLLASLLVLSMVLAACAPATAPADSGTAAGGDEAMGDGPTTISLWYHGAGNNVEGQLVTQIIDEFNASQDEWVVELQDFPQESYNESIVAARVGWVNCPISSMSMVRSCRTGRGLATWLR